MKCFELINTVLDEAYEELEGVDLEKDSQINAALSKLGEEYRRAARKAVDIDYADPVTRFAYVYKYVTCHANLVSGVLGESDAIRSVGDGDTLRVSCIGGGPGSDFIGVLKHLKEHGRDCFVQCFLLDGEEAWNEAWCDVALKMNTSAKVATSFSRFDATEPSSLSKSRKFLSADLLTLVYFLSELHSCKDVADPTLRKILLGAKLGSKLLYIDNNASDFTDWFDELAKATNYVEEYKGAGVRKLPTDEEKRALGIYYRKFSHNPKLTANVAYRVMRKQ